MKSRSPADALQKAAQPGCARTSARTTQASELRASRTRTNRCPWSIHTGRALRRTLEAPTSRCSPVSSLELPDEHSIRTRRVGRIVVLDSSHKKDSRRRRDDEGADAGVEPSGPGAPRAARATALLGPSVPGCSTTHDGSAL